MDKYIQQITKNFAEVKEYISVNNLFRQSISDDVYYIKDQLSKLEGRYIEVSTKSGGGGGSADGVTTAGVFNGGTNSIDFTVAAPGADFSIDVSALVGGGGGSTTASNGLSIDGTSGDVQLGGTLLQDTNVEQDGNKMSFNGLGQFSVGTSATQTGYKFWGEGGNFAWTGNTGDAVDLPSTNGLFVLNAKGAIRGGTLVALNSTDALTGLNSVAFGYRPEASGATSVSFGSGNKASGISSSVTGGSSNTASGSHSVVSGGKNGLADGAYSVLSGGLSNTSSGTYSTMGGGFTNEVSGLYGFLGGGRNNILTGRDGVISGGRTNTASGNHSVVSGGNANNATASNATVGGGNANNATDLNATVSGGVGNLASKLYATVGGGKSNTASSSFATVGGGEDNTASSSQSVVAGGENNTASAPYSTVSGGFSNVASGGNSTISGGEGNTSINIYGSVGGGLSNAVASLYGTIAGGLNNAAGKWASVGGGWDNKASSSASTVAGGRDNEASSSYSTVGGGQGNDAGGSWSFVGGGQNNRATGSNGATIAGGTLNNASGARSFIGGGAQGTASGENSAIGGGRQNVAKDLNSTVAGGFGNNATGVASSVGGGQNSIASGSHSTISGGYTNGALGDYSTVIGGVDNKSQSFGELSGGLFSTLYTPASVIAWNIGDRLFNIGNGQDVVNRADALTILKSGNIGIGINNFEADALNVNPIAHSNGARLTATGQWTNTSDTDKKFNQRALDLTKTQFMALDPKSYEFKVGNKNTDTLNILRIEQLQELYIATGNAGVGGWWNSNQAYVLDYLAGNNNGANFFTASAAVIAEVVYQYEENSLLRQSTGTAGYTVTDTTSHGFIAQEVELIIPELVNGPNGDKAMDYVGLIPLITKMVQDILNETDAVDYFDNSTTTIKTLSNTPLSGRRLDVYKNGLLLRETEDYTITGSTVTLLIAPQISHLITIKYKH